MFSQKKIPVGILGATGMVGQKFIELLQNHPWFDLVFLAASEKSQGKRYADVTDWRMSCVLEKKIADLVVQSCVPEGSCVFVFSALDAEVAADIEKKFAAAGCVVFSNARVHRMDPSVPLVIPEVNGEHLKSFSVLSQFPGKIITNPNCSVIGLSLALKPLFDKWGIANLHVTTLQAVSGAGYPGVSSFDMIDNVIPFIAGEEEKLETEPCKIFGQFSGLDFLPSDMKISAQCNRVAVLDGHMACISLKLKKRATSEEIIQAWDHFTAYPQLAKLPSAPDKPLIYSHEKNYPQPKLHRMNGKGMTATIGRLRPCGLNDFKFVVLSHNTIRGAAGGAILNAEMVASFNNF